MLEKGDKNAAGSLQKCNFVLDRHQREPTRLPGQLSVTTEKCRCAKIRYNNDYPERLSSSSKFLLVLSYDKERERPFLLSCIWLSRDNKLINESDASESV